MISEQEYIQFKAYARQYGAVMGLLWVVSFACFVGGMQWPMLSFGFQFSVMLIPFIASFFVRMYRDGVINGVISFRRAFAFSMLIFFYAMLILAIAQWAYFQYMDDGRVMGNMMKVVTSPEYEEMLKQMQIDKELMKQQIESLAEVRPIDFALSFMWMNSLAGLIISWLVALFTKRSKIVKN